jgi:YHS domain-containing protein
MEFFRESDRAGKKYVTKINGKTYHFGSEGSETYLDHKDKSKRYNYIARHRANEISTLVLSHVTSCGGRIPTWIKRSHHTSSGLN